MNMANLGGTRATRSYTKRRDAIDPPTLWPTRIYLLEQLGRETEAAELVTRCRLEYPGSLASACRRTSSQVGGKGDLAAGPASG